MAFARGLRSAASRQLDDPSAGTTYVSGALTGMLATVVTGRRPDAGAVYAIAGILAGAALGVGLLETAADLTPFLAVAGVAFTTGLSWIEYHHISGPTIATPHIGTPGQLDG